MPDQSPSYAEMQRAIDYATDRAIRGVTDLFKAELRAIGIELQGINGRLAEQSKLAQEVAGLDSRITAAEAFISSHEKRMNADDQDRKDARRWWRDHYLSIIGIAMALVLGAHQLGLF